MRNVSCAPGPIFALVFMTCLTPLLHYTLRLCGCPLVVVIFAVELVLQLVVFSPPSGGAPWLAAAKKVPWYGSDFIDCKSVRPHTSGKA